MTSASALRRTARDAADLGYETPVVLVDADDSAIEQVDGLHVAQQKAVSVVTGAAEVRLDDEAIAGIGNTRNGEFGAVDRYRIPRRIRKTACAVDAVSVRVEEFDRRRREQIRVTGINRCGRRYGRVAKIVQMLVVPVKCIQMMEGPIKKIEEEAGVSFARPFWTSFVDSSRNS